MNLFRESILKKYSNIQEEDFLYFTNTSMKKIKAMGLPVKECIINDTFVGSKYTLYYQLEYCLINCGFKCLNGKDFKRKKK